jgi:FAD/FMN-containing dehydrogenase/Fe-S oxidoreductase
MKAPHDVKSLEQRLRREVDGEILFDGFTRGRYSTDASIYQIMPMGVVIPRTVEAMRTSLTIARTAEVPFTPRGAGTSQGGQAIGPGLVVDTSKYLTAMDAPDLENRTVSVEPGVVLDRLNAALKPHGLFFPVDVATASQATIGGMAGNNSAGSRSIRYGLMRDNVRTIEATLGRGGSYTLAPASMRPTASFPLHSIVTALRGLYEQEALELEQRLPKVLRHVAGYNLQSLAPPDPNLAQLLVGSEGTLALFTRLTLQLQPLPPHKVLGVCQFPTLHAAMDAVQHIVRLEPSAVELTDHTLISLARDNPEFRDAVDRFLKGNPAAVLVVEFSGDDHDEQVRGLHRLEELMGDLGFPDAVVRAVELAFQREIWSVRKAALNIVMSMKGDGKPVSFIEDCAVPLEHLAEYTARLSETFAAHGTTGTWYAHASVGCLHVRPTLNMKKGEDVKRMRDIAEAAHELVREYKGSHSGEHGDGIVRSEFIRPMLGDRLADAFGRIKAMFDPKGILNPGKIVDPPRMDDRGLMRYAPGYAPTLPALALDWSSHGGFDRAIEMCNNNGACRKSDPGIMCPSYRVTRDERDVTRGRANALRLALSGQLGPDALTSDAMYETMDLCVGCKGCRRECPTGVDMAKMKVEFLHQYRRRHGVPVRDRLIANLPRYAPLASRVPLLANLPNGALPSRMRERFPGFTSKRPLPEWSRRPYRAPDAVGEATPDVVLWVDTFNTYFEPENARAARRVLEAGGYSVATPVPLDGGRPVCCGRTFLNAGLVEQARAEARRTVDALRPFADQDIPIVGLEPSCLLTLRDEFLTLGNVDGVEVVAQSAMLLEEFLAARAAEGSLNLPLTTPEHRTVHVHGHCHQKAFGVLEHSHRALSLIPGVEVLPIESGCCGMAGSFGYEVEHHDVSMKMAELQLLPAVRGADAQAWIVADGTSCRRQIADGTGREAVHAARVLDAALATKP